MLRATEARQGSRRAPRPSRRASLPMPTPTITRSVYPCTFPAPNNAFSFSAILFQHTLLPSRAATLFARSVAAITRTRNQPCCRLSRLPLPSNVTQKSLRHKHKRFTTGMHSGWAVSWTPVVLRALGRRQDSPGGGRSHGWLGAKMRAARRPRRLATIETAPAAASIHQAAASGDSGGPHLRSARPSRFAASSEALSLIV